MYATTKKSIKVRLVFKFGLDLGLLYHEPLFRKIQSYGFDFSGNHKKQVMTYRRLDLYINMKTIFFYFFNSLTYKGLFIFSIFFWFSILKFKIDIRSLSGLRLLNNFSKMKNS